MSSFTKYLAIFMSQAYLLKLIFEACLLFSPLRESSFERYFGGLKFGKVLFGTRYFGLVSDILSSILGLSLFYIRTKGKSGHIDESSVISGLFLIGIVGSDLLGTYLGSGVMNFGCNGYKIPLSWIIPAAAYFILARRIPKNGEVFSTVIPPQQQFVYFQAPSSSLVQQPQNWIMYRTPQSEPVILSNPFQQHVLAEQQAHPQTSLAQASVGAQTHEQVQFSSNQEAGPHGPPLYNMPIEGFPSSSDSKL